MRCDGHREVTRGSCAFAPVGAPPGLPLRARPFMRVLWILGQKEMCWFQHGTGCMFTTNWRVWPLHKRLERRRALNGVPHSSLCFSGYPLPGPSPFERDPKNREGAVTRPNFEAAGTRTQAGVPVSPRNSTSRRVGMGVGGDTGFSNVRKQGLNRPLVVPWDHKRRGVRLIRADSGVVAAQAGSSMNKNIT